ncbi:MAG: alkaline phosphatase D family protein [Solirubrobacterales bacterium]
MAEKIRKPSSRELDDLELLDREIDRRAFLQLGCVGGVIATDPLGVLKSCNRPKTLAKTPPLASGGAFLHGVASGQPSQSAVSLWTRLDGFESTRRVTVEVATDPEFQRVVYRRRPWASVARDFAVYHRVRGLKAGEQYYYRFTTRTSESRVGKFRTARPANSLEPVRIGVFSCQDYQAGYYTAQAGIAEEDLDLVVCLGDYIYEKTFYQGPSDRKDTTGANNDGEVQTLDEYRSKYRLYHTDENLQAMRAAHPIIGIWDDHEVEDNYAGDEPGEATDDRRVGIVERKRVGYLAYFEWMPQCRIAGDENRIYRKLGLGGNADLFLLDQRQYRDDQPCGDQLAVPCPEAEEPGRTLLGRTQKNWLKGGLESSRATWKLVGNQVMIMSLDLPNGNELNPDQWDGYQAERAEILGHVRDKGVDNVSFLTGDIHTFFAGDVSPTGRQDNTGSPDPVATEFVCGSATSLGIPSTVASQEVTGSEQEAIGVLTENVQLFNPHIKYNEQDSRGYGVIEARPDELRVQFRAPGSTMQRTSPIRTLQGFTVARDDPRVQVQGGVVEGPTGPTVKVPSL